MPFVPVPQFSAAVQSLLSDGFEPVRGVAISKGRHQLKLMQNVEDGALAAMATASRQTRFGTVEAAITSELMLCTTLAAEPPIPGLALRVDSAVGAQGVMPIAGLEAMYTHERATVAASASPAAGLVASLTTGVEPFMVGGAALVQPDGRRNLLLGATLGGAITAIVTMPQGGPPLVHASAVLQPTGSLMVGAMIEKVPSRPPTTAFGAAFAHEPLGFSVKGMVLAGTAERPDGSYPFAVAKAAVIKIVDSMQLGLSVEQPLRVPADASSKPKVGCTFGISFE